MSHAFSVLRRSILISACAALLTACGGGSSSSSSLTIDSLTYSPSAPTSGVPVSVVSTVTASSDITSVTYAWSQTSGPSVSLSGASAATVYFTAPTVTVDSTVVLTLTVSSGSVSASQSVSIPIAP